MMPPTYSPDSEASFSERCSHEDHLRTQIEAALAAAGWIVQPHAEVDPGAGLGVAVREFPIASGPVDYALFVGSDLCGVIAAKPAGAAPSGFADEAGRDIADGPGHLVRPEGQTRFAYIASSSELLFRDHADPAPRARRVFFFHRPETLQRWLADDATIRRRLQAMPPLVAQVLRDCQAGAVRSLEASLAGGEPRSLIQMAAGAGKTFTAATFSHRLLEHGKFRRILFLADRASLVRQARDEFLAYRAPATAGAVTAPLEIQALGAEGLDYGAAVVISTMKRLYAVLTATALSEEDEERSGFEGSTDEAERVVPYNPDVPIETFDLVIIDACHHSVYEAWRPVLDYFDAFMVGLTAMPSRPALGFFDNNLIAQYPYERAVADGVSVGYEVYRIRAEAGEHGVKVSKGYAPAVRDRRTHAERCEELGDDFAPPPNPPPQAGEDISICPSPPAGEGRVGDPDRTVAAPGHIRTVLQAFRDSLFTELFPGRTAVPKTLIFARDDDHAEAIAEIACEVFDAGREFAHNIARRADTADPDALIRRFRSDYNPRIAVTVDMIATGTDVSPLEALIFLRDVKSAPYFEQMKGRGACTITPAALRQVTPDAQEKTRFVVIDAVGVTESLNQVTAPLERERAEDAKQPTQARIDTIPTDVVYSGGHDENTARNAVDKFEAFLDMNRDRLVALQILHGRSRPGQKLDRAAIEAVREVLRRPPWLMEPVDIWRAYVRLDEDRVKGNPAGTLSDIVMLVRYGIGASSTLKPLSAIAVSRFNFWLLREERAGRVYTEAQRAWLRAMRDYIADNVAIAPRDLMEARDFAAFAPQGGLSLARALFGARLEPLLEELPQFLVA
jgi:type I restriction enzyme R subunit